MTRHASHTSPIPVKTMLVQFRTIIIKYESSASFGLRIATWFFQATLRVPCVTMVLNDHDGRFVTHPLGVSQTVAPGRQGASSQRWLWPDIKVNKAPEKNPAKRLLKAVFGSKKSSGK
jgi:hypothetical protein